MATIQSPDWNVSCEHDLLTHWGFHIQGVEYKCESYEKLKDNIIFLSFNKRKSFFFVTSFDLISTYKRAQKVIDVSSLTLDQKIPEGMVIIEV